MIIDRLVKRIQETDNPTVVGLDPQIDFIPKHLMDKNMEIYGETLRGAANAFFEFNKGIIDAVYDIVPAVKPQIAMYELLGADGIDCYIKTINYAKEKNLIVIGDIKRSDIASTASCYSAAHIGEVQIGSKTYKPFDSDFITVNPLMGEDAVSPFFDDMRKGGKGIFVLVKTSNPGSGLFFDIMAQDKPLYLHIANFVCQIAGEFTGQYGYSSVGAVAAATHPEQLIKLRAAMPGIFFLIPGYGAQGGTSAAIKGGFVNGEGAIVNSSRGIIAAYKSDKFKNLFRPEEFAAAARIAALEMKKDLKF